MLLHHWYSCKDDRMTSVCFREYFTCVSLWELSKTNMLLRFKNTTAQLWHIHFMQFNISVWSIYSVSYTLMITPITLTSIMAFFLGQCMAAVFFHPWWCRILQYTVSCCYQLFVVTLLSHCLVQGNFWIHWCSICIATFRKYVWLLLSKIDSILYKTW